MKVAIIGGGPGGLYLAILLRRANPATQVVIYERNRIEDTFGFGVVLSDATEGILAEADDVTHAAMSAVMHRWGDIDVHINGQCITSGGHGFSGISRKVLLEILSDRARAIGAELRELTEAPPVETLLASHDLVVAADGVNSAVRESRKAAFGASVDLRPNRFVWLGTSRPFPSFFFSFRQNAHGLWRVHAYQYAEGESTFIVETTEAAWQAAGLKENDEAATIAYCEALFKEELEGHRLVANRSIWRQFPTVRCERWSDGRLVLLGDAAHTAHFSVGSGTKLAMEDAIELSRVLQGAPDVAAALATYEEQRRPGVASVQRAAQASLEWFEATERYDDLEPLQFAYSLLTRSLRITHENLRTRDPAFVERVERWYADKAGVVPVPGRRSPPPFLTPFKLRDLVLTNRVVVSPMCQYSAVDGVPNDWHLQHLASRAVGGAGLVMTEMTDVSAEGRITPGCTGIYNDAQVAAWRRIVDFVRDARARHADRHAAGTCGAEGGDEADVGGRQRAPPDGSLADHVGERRSVEEGEPGSPRDDARATWTGCATSSWALSGALSRRDSTSSRSTWPTATCWRASSARSPTGAPTSTAGRSRTGCAFRSRCSARCARRGRRRSRSRRASRPPTGIRTDSPGWNQSRWRGSSGRRGWTRWTCRRGRRCRISVLYMDGRSRRPLPTGSGTRRGWRRWRWGTSRATRTSTPSWRRGAPTWC